MNTSIESANTSGLTPAVFVHGLWLLPSSWDRWAQLYAENGFAPVLPGWPDDPETVEEAKGTPGGLRQQDRRAGRRPLRRGHRDAGQEARGHRPLVRRPARPDPRRPRAVGGDGRDRPGAVPRRAAAADLRAAGPLPVLSNPLNRHRAVPLTEDQFRYAFANARQRGRGEGAVRDLHRPGAGRAAVPGRDREPEPVDRGQGRHRQPGPRPAADHLRREGPHRAVGDRQRRPTSSRRQPGRDRDRRDPEPGHALTIDSGWREVAEKALEFVKRFV